MITIEKTSSGWIVSWQSLCVDSVSVKDGQCNATIGDEHKYVKTQEELLKAIKVLTE